MNGSSQGTRKSGLPAFLLGLFSTVILGSLVIGGFFLVSTPTASASNTYQQTGCQFSILEFKSCLVGNCAHYDVPLKNEANTALTVNGRVVIEGQGGVELASQAFSNFTIPANSTAVLSGEVCASGPLPAGPYQIKVYVQDIPRACQEKSKEQPLTDRCAAPATETTVVTATATVVTATATVARTPGPDETPGAQRTHTPEPENSPTAVPAATGTTVPGGGGGGTHATATPNYGSDVLGLGGGNVPTNMGMPQTGAAQDRSWLPYSLLVAFLAVTAGILLARRRKASGSHIER